MLHHMEPHIIKLPTHIHPRFCTLEIPCAGSLILVPNPYHVGGM